MILPPIERRPFAAEPSDRLRAMVMARVDAALETVPYSPADVVEVEINGDVDEALADRVCMQLEAAWLARTVRVRIDSIGGEFAAAMRLYRALRWHAAPMKVALVGKRAMSAAAIVLLACDQRIARPDSQILIHFTSETPTPSERWTAARYLEAALRLRELDSVMVNMIADRTGADLEEIAREAATEDESTVDWCLAHGLITAIAEPMEVAA